MGLVAGVLQILKQQQFSNIVLVGTVAIALLPLISRLWQDFRAGSYGVNILAVIAIAAAFMAQEYWAMLAIILVTLGSEILNDSAITVSQRPLQGLLTPTPADAHIQHKNKVVDVAVHQVSAH